MNKFYPRLHNAKNNFKKQVLGIGLLLFLILHIGTNAHAQCDVNPVANQAVCNNTSTTAINFTGTATTFSWTNNTTSIGLAASGTGNIASFTALNPSAVAVIATITVTPSTGACTGAAITFSITANPSPVVTVTPATSCGGVQGVGLCNPLTASGADSYTWSPFAGLYTNCTLAIPYTGSNSATVYATPTSFTVYTVTGTNSVTGCSNTATAQVNYNPPVPTVIPTAVFKCLSDPSVKLKVASGPGTVQFCSGPVNIPVPDNNPSGASNSINVAGVPLTCLITGMTVTINIPHTRIGDMVFVLKAPNGQIMNLDYHLTGTGGNGATTGFVNSIISSTGTAALSTGTNPYTGTFKADAQFFPTGGFGATGPTGMQPTAINWSSLLSVLNGTWTLGFYDGVTSELGTLSSWCIGFNYSCPAIPATPAVWSPSAGLFLDPAATIPYVAGTARDSVWTRPVPSGVYTYEVTTQAVPAPLCTPTTNFVSTNGNSTITFNVKNNHPFPIRIFQIDSKTLNAGTTFTSAYYKAAAVNGPPGAISAANGWTQFGSSVVNGTGSSVQPFLSNLQLVMPAGTTYGICVQATTSGNLPNLSYSALSPGNYPFNAGGCELITGTNIGYSGANVPAAPTTALSGFVGAVYFSQATINCTSPPRSVVVTVGLPATITAQPLNQTVCTSQAANFTVVVNGSGGLNYQWQVSSNGGSTFTNIVNGGVYTGATTATLTVTAPPFSMNGYQYRVIITGTSACATVTSGIAVLTVNPLPDVVITASPYTTLCPSYTTTIFSSVSPNPAATYTWFRDGTVVPAANADTILVDINGLGEYQLEVTDINGCTNLSNKILIHDSTCRGLFIYPNPSSGRFQVRSHSEANNSTARSMLIYNNRGELLLTKSYIQNIPYERIDLDIRRYGKGLYWIVLTDQNGKRLAINKAVIQ